MEGGREVLASRLDGVLWDGLGWDGNRIQMGPTPGIVGGFI